ncbi:MAG: hypothetical protein J3R72DRAFT_56059 [Linnemannia gamsii]|nr:MAG: hypothetical protein J3R72DRAFT_56059 [Linnemannia gamsii]
MVANRTGLHVQEVGEVASSVAFDNFLSRTRDEQDHLPQNEASPKTYTKATIESPTITTRATGISSTASPSTSTSAVATPLTGASATPAPSTTTRKRRSSIVEPWGTLACALLEKLNGSRATIDPGNQLMQSNSSQRLYDFVRSQLLSKDPWEKIAEKDTFVAISGIINARMENARGIFGDTLIDDIRKTCLRSDMHVPSKELVDILKPLKAAYKAGGILGLQCEAEIAMGEEAKRRRSGIDTTPLRYRVLDAIRHIIRSKPNENMSEGEVVAVWRYILIALSGDCLKFRSGELTSKATRWQRRLMKMDYDVNPGKPTYGRKVDLQCTIDKFELNNSEFKVSGASPQQMQVQFRKNLRLNQSMVLYIHGQIGMPLENLEVLALDVRGLTGTIFSMKYLEDVFVSDLASSHALRLPEHGARWERFLEGHTLAVLLNYLDYLLILQDQILARMEEHEEELMTSGSKPASPGSRDIGLYTFFTPSKKQKLVDLPLVLSSAWTTDDLDELEENEDQEEESESALD